MKIRFWLALAIVILSPAGARAASKTDYCDQRLKGDGTFDVVCDQGKGPAIFRNWLGTFTANTIAKARAGDPKSSVMLGEFYQYFRDAVGPMASSGSEDRRYQRAVSGWEGL